MSGSGRRGVRARLILASDRVSRGEREDRTAAGVAALLATAGVELAEVVAVPDELAALVAALLAGCACRDLVLTSGGTGIGPRDVTPEATRAVIEREIPGLGEAMRAASLGKVPTAALSRATAGTRGAALVVNLPGSPSGARECLAAVLPALLHGVRLLTGGVADCQAELGAQPHLTPAGPATSPRRPSAGPPPAGPAARA
ncbi:MAG TPA: MogA/MoaB family molybdenum cofactor biosynthesis protein [Planctomycetota bacterium]|nr:MogA/MoaB family molybdenum cofactor biosynthesis protein [Planctomycetota bacterium]